MGFTVASTDSSATPAPRGRRVAQTASYYAGFIALGLVAAVAGPTLPDLAGQTGAQLQGISILFTVRSLGYLLGSLQSGVLYDRYRGHPIMAAAIICIAALMALV